MKVSIKKFAISLVIFAITIVFFMLCAFAEGTGYALNKDKQETNIKWTVKDQILTLEIDASATDKVASTTIDVNPVTGAPMGYGSKVEEFQDITKCVIGDGITSASRILSNIPTLLEVEIPTSLVKITALFEQSKALESVYVKGTKPVKYHADLSYIKTFGNCNFNASGPIKTVTFGDGFTGTIPQETFQWNSRIEEITIPAGVAKVGAKAFANCNGMKVMTILGKDTQIDVNAFFNNKYFPAIKAYAGSAAEKFAKENGYTFINMETGEETKGTKPSSVDANKPSEDKTEVTTEAKPEATTPTQPSTTPFAGSDNGYALNGSKQVTNIKWTVKDRILTFEIDASATDKVASTTLDVNPVTGEPMGYGSKVEEFQNITKCVIGDGITSASRILSNIPTLLEVEIPTSLVKITALFEQSKALESVYVKGTKPVKYHADLSYIKTFGNCNFNASGPIKTVTFGDGFTGTIPQETFQWNSNIEEITIPAGVAKVGAKAFANCNGMKVMTILGKDTQIDVNAFFNNKYYPAIKAYVGSAAEKFAKENGYSFINIETGEETEGTKPLPGEIHKLPVSEFDTTGATAHGLMYEKGLTDNYWAYYAERKTLVIATRTLYGYNETGSLGDCEGKGWSDYINEIEHIEIIGNRLDKISGYAFQNHKALIDVKVKGNPGQWDPGAFKGCTNLTTIWYEGGERVEGRADISSCGKVNNIFAGTAVKEVLISGKIKNIEVGLPFSVRTILTPNITEELIQYCKDNNFDLVNSKNPEEKYSFYIEIDPTLPYCGDRAVYDFDEATGTLTVYGSGSIPDIMNFFGGGSKNQWWRSIRNSVKHIVISDGITSIGKYAFCELRNVESIRLPDRDNLMVWNCAFQSCEKVKYITRGDNEPILGTADLSGVSNITSWSFAYNYLIANVILSDSLTEVGSTAFEDCFNLQNVYAAPGTFGESFAKDRSLSFYDVSSNIPQAIECELPETTANTEENADGTNESDDTNDIGGVGEADKETETTGEFYFIDPEEYEKAELDDSSDDNGGIMILVIAAAAAAVVVVAAVVIILARKHKK